MQILLDEATLPPFLPFLPPFASFSCDLRLCDVNDVDITVDEEIPLKKKETATAEIKAVCFQRHYLRSAELATLVNRRLYRESSQISESPQSDEPSLNALVCDP